MKKLVDILSEAFENTPKVDRHQVVEGVRNFGIVVRPFDIIVKAPKLSDTQSDIFRNGNKHVVLHDYIVSCVIVTCQLYHVFCFLET